MTDRPRLMSDDDMLTGAAPASVPRMIVFPHPCNRIVIGICCWSLVLGNRSVPQQAANKTNYGVLYLPRAFEGFGHE